MAESHRYSTKWPMQPARLVSANEGGKKKRTVQRGTVRGSRDSQPHARGGQTDPYPCLLIGKSRPTVDTRWNLGLACFALACLGVCTLGGCRLTVERGSWMKACWIGKYGSGPPELSWRRSAKSRYLLALASLAYSLVVVFTCRNSSLVTIQGIQV